MRRFLLRLIALFRAGRAEAELTREIDAHLRLLEDRFVQNGLSADEARLAARRAFGGVEQTKERQRDERSFRWMDESWLDLKLGARMLVKFPGITLIAVIALAVAIGAGAAYLEFVTEAIRPSLPVPGGDRIVGIQQWDIVGGRPEPRVVRAFRTWRDGVTSIELLGASRLLERNLIGNDSRVELVHGVEISASAFRLIPVRPLLGRPLVEEDERAGAPDVVVIGQALWRDRFGSDPAIVGKTVRLGNDTHSVVGVMPENFGFPINQSLWTPLRVHTLDFGNGEGPALRMFGRLKPGITTEAAESELLSILSATRADDGTERPLRPQVRPYVESLWQSIDNGRLQMRVLYSVNLFFVGLLLLCGANVATLVFGRTITREAEITVRTALGASRRRIIAQLFAEGLVLTSLATVVGLATASFALRWGRANWLAGADGGAAAPFWWDDRLSPETVLYAAVLAVLAAVIVGVVPAAKATGPQMQSRLKAAAAGSGLRFGGVWTAVIVGQVAITVVFMLSVVSIGWDFYANEYRGGEVAFARERYLSARLAGPDPERTARSEAAFVELQRRLSGEPGVRAVTSGTAFPGMQHSELFVEFRDAPAKLPKTGPLLVQSVAVAANFFDVFNAPIAAGRAFTSADLALNRPVAIVDQTFVQQVLDGRNPIGQWVRQPQRSENPEAGRWYEIVGVIGDLSIAPGKTSEDAIIYFPFAEASANMHIAVQLEGDGRAFAPRLRTLAFEVEPTLRLHEVLSLDQVNQSDRLAAEFFMRAFALVSVLALLLSTAGVFSMMAFAVARRTREIGIRVAIGADRWQILTGVFLRAFRQVAVGVAIGSVPGGLLVMAGAPEVAKGSTAGWVILAVTTVAAVMMTVTLLACAVPARRAFGVHPADALRAD